MSVLRRLLPLVALCSLAAPTQVLAFADPVGSPPGWRTYWVQTFEDVEVFAHASGDASFGQAPAGLFFRIDAPEQNGRFWAYEPLFGSWAWLSAAGTQPVAEPSEDDLAASLAAFDPRSYLYQQAPDLAPQLDCIIAGESGWDPSQINARSRAAGLAQFLPSTWASTPEGAEGQSPLDARSNIDAAIWLARAKGWQQWQVYLQGRCH